MKEFLTNPMITKVFQLDLRADFQKVDYEIIKQQFDLKLDNSFLPSQDYYKYKSDKILFQNGCLIIYSEYFKIISLDKDKLEELFNKIKSLAGITISDITELTETTYLKLIYPFIFSDYLNLKSNEDFSERIYEKSNIMLNFLKEGLRENDLNFYIGYYILSALVEEILAKIAIKEGKSLNRGFTIGAHVKDLKGEKYLLTQHDSEGKKEGKTRKLKIYHEQLNSENIFVLNKDKAEGMRIISLLDEIADIRTKYVHFSMQEPNNPSDFIVGIINFGQFMRWCENNGYL